MKDLTVFNHNGILVTDSREVAGMINRPHNDLMKSIRQYCEYLTAGDFPLSDFFIPSTYRDSTGRELPCYLVTRKGCEMIANKMTGEKGVLFTATYINGFHAMEDHIKSQAIEIDSLNAQARELRAQAMSMNAKTRALQTLMKTTDNKNLSHIALEVYGLKAAGAITGTDFGSHLPQVEKTYSATEIGKMFGVTSKKVGSIANKNGLKTDEYGITVLDKSPYSAKEVSSFRYNQRGVDVIGELLGHQAGVPQ